MIIRVKRGKSNLCSEDRELGSRSILSPRYPISISTKNKDNTILKQRYIYREYQDLVNRINDVFPDMAKFLPKKYYYMVVAERLGLSEGYVSISVTQYIKNHSVAEVGDKECKHRRSVNVLCDK